MADYQGNNIQNLGITVDYKPITLSFHIDGSSISTLSGKLREELQRLQRPGKEAESRSSDNKCISSLFTSCSIDSDE